MRARLLFFDADDTLWDNQSHHDSAEVAIVALLMARGLAELDAWQGLRRVHRAVVSRTGVGPHVHVDAARAAFRELVGPLDLDAAAAIDAAFRGVFRGARTILPGVERGLEALASRHRLVVVTRGVHDHQWDKLDASGLPCHFESVHVVAEKTPELFTELCHAAGFESHEAAMIGNSARSDIRPALAAGLWAVHIPFESEAHFDVDDAALHHPRLVRLERFEELTELFRS